MKSGGPYGPIASQAHLSGQRSTLGSRVMRLFSGIFELRIRNLLLGRRDGRSLELVGDVEAIPLILIWEEGNALLVRY